MNAGCEACIATHTHHYVRASHYKHQAFACQLNEREIITPISSLDCRVFASKVVGTGTPSPSHGKVEEAGPPYSTTSSRLRVV